MDLILGLNEQALLESLLIGRFDKKKIGTGESFTMIVGDEGGLFLLMNSVSPNSRFEKIILDSGVSEKYLKEKRDVVNNKVIIGQGGFGKVRLALSVLGNQIVDIGQVVCIKKSRAIGDTESKDTSFLRDIVNSALEDFFTRRLNASIYAPVPLDMSIINNSNFKNPNDSKHRKGYLIMELVPENTAD